MKIIVVAAILKDDNLTLVTNKGEYIKLPQGDKRIRPILDQVLPVISDGGQAEVDLTENTSNAYEDFEKKSGVVKFFRVAKNALKDWFGIKSLVVAEGTYGKIPDSPTEDELKTLAVKATAPASLREETLQEIIANSEPVTGLVFNTESKEVKLPEGETIIAVVDNKTIVPNAQNLHAQVARANSLGDQETIENFMRLAGEIPRLHSMEDLIAFIGKLDMPLTKSGHVLAYKNLNQGPAQGEYVDPFTNRVRQWVGCRVFMNEKLVDPNRGQDCSNGLHVASRSYLSGYGGTGGTFLIRIKPSDVIAVPKYNTNKMRVCSYDILGKLSPEDARAVCNNRPLQTDEGKRLLAAAVADRATRITHSTEITGDRGGGCIYSTYDSADRILPNAEFEQDSLEDLGMVEPLDPENPENGQTVPVASVMEELETIHETKTLTRKEQAKALYDAWAVALKGNAMESSSWTTEAEALAALNAFKKSCKVSWEKLGLPSSPNGNVLPPNTDPVAAISTADVGKAFEEATATPRDDFEDSNDLGELYDDFVAGDSGSEEEYQAAVKLVALFKQSNLQFDEDGFCDDLLFEQADYELVEQVVARWERNALQEKLAGPETASEADEDAPAVTVTAKGKTYREQIRELLNKGTLTIGTAKEILAIKKSSKKGWSALGVTADEAFDIEEQAKTD